MQSTVGSDRVQRFGRVQRLVHRTTGWLMAFCAGTAACLYFSPLAELVGRRLLVVAVHEISGILLPVPLLLGLFSAEFGPISSASTGSPSTTASGSGSR
ncbi:hypothetical protein [Kutzneria kofuensis]|uniref:hypothetical protein n=1 Tax=Kutzneria kofuensis TaxID=103725 RepID=UPI0031EAECFB